MIEKKYTDIKEDNQNRNTRSNGYDEDAVNALKEDLKKTLSIKDVFERYYYPVRKLNSDSYTAICPFHTERNDGTFNMSISKGISKCFSCGAGGDIVGLTRRRYNCSYVDAIYKLALDYGYITEDEYNKKNIVFDEKYEIAKTEKLKEKMKEINTNEAELRDENTIEKIYEIFSKTSPLSSSDYEYLLNERNIPDTRINDTYFTMPICTQGFMRKFKKALEEEGLSLEDLLGVPGFFKDEEKDAIIFQGSKGIGIKIRNAKGVITGIQIRLTKAKIDEKTGKQNRYTWFSSARKNMGCSPGSPVDVSYPDLRAEDMMAVVFITEGKFKSERINKYYNSVCLSVQGVTSWKDKIVKEIEEVQKNINIKYVFLCYDADMAINAQVYQQCKQMVEVELSNLFTKDKVFMVSWDISKGKGIDDLIDNGYKDSVKKAEFPRFVELFEKFLSKYPRNNKGELIDKDTNGVLSKDKLYDDYMKEVFPLL